MAWRVQKECLKKPALRLEDGDSDHRLKPTGTHSGCQSHRDRSFPYHPGLVAPGLLAARVPPPAVHASSRSRGHPRPALPRSGCPKLPSPPRAFLLSPRRQRDSRSHAPGSSGALPAACAPTSEKAEKAASFLPSLLPSFPFPAQGGRLRSLPPPPSGPRPSGSARPLPPPAVERDGVGTPAPCPSRGAPHSPRRARRAASETWG